MVGKMIRGDPQMLQQKIGVMVLNGGESIVKLYDSVRSKGKCWLFMEKMAGHINEPIEYFLRQKLTQQEILSYTEKFVKYTAYSILKGLKFLHENDVIHM